MNDDIVDRKLVVMLNGAYCCTGEGYHSLRLRWIAVDGTTIAIGWPYWHRGVLFLVCEKLKPSLPPAHYNHSWDKCNLEVD